MRSHSKTSRRSSASGARSGEPPSRDSAQLLRLAPDALTWADLGTGAGLPGIVLAILGKDRPGFHVHLVESMAKRCRFLTEVVTGLQLPATVHQSRAEDLSLAVDIVTARAVAPLYKGIPLFAPALKKGARLLLYKGPDMEAEIAEAGNELKRRKATARVVMITSNRTRLPMLGGAIPDTAIEYQAVGLFAGKYLL